MPQGSWGKSAAIFDVDISSYVHVDNKKKDILVVDDEPTQILDYVKITAEAKDHTNITESEKRFVLSLHFNGSKSFLIVNAVKMYQFKAKDSEIKPYPLSLGNISKDFPIDYMKKTDLKD